MEVSEESLDEYQNDIGAIVVVAFPFEAENEDELACEAGTRIRTLEQRDEWWFAQRVDNESLQGIIPISFCVSEEEYKLMYERNGSLDEATEGDEDDTYQLPKSSTQSIVQESSKLQVTTEPEPDIDYDSLMSKFENLQARVQSVKLTSQAVVEAQDQMSQQTAEATSPPSPVVSSPKSPSSYATMEADRKAQQQLLAKAVAAQGSGQGVPPPPSPAQAMAQMQPPPPSPAQAMAQMQPPPPSPAQAMAQMQPPPPSPAQAMAQMQPPPPSPAQAMAQMQPPPPSPAQAMAQMQPPPPAPSQAMAQMQQQQQQKPPPPAADVAREQYLAMQARQQEEEKRRIQEREIESQKRAAAMYEAREEAAKQQEALRQQDMKDRQFLRNMTHRTSDNQHEGRQAMDNAIAAVKQAVQHDNNGRFADAYNAYIQACELFSIVLQRNAMVPQHPTIIQRMKGYLDRMTVIESMNVGVTRYKKGVQVLVAMVKVGFDPIPVGDEYALQARNAESKKNLEGALRYYTHAVEYYMSLHQALKDTGKAMDKRLVGNMSNLLDSAERLRKALGK